jgi:hypothetical protein
MKQKEWDILHTSPEYKLWRKEVYHRDGFKCRECGSNNKIEAHHIIPLRIDFEKRFDINNGITLCKKHHRLVFGKEMQLVKHFQDLINGVNSVELLRDNTEPTQEENLLKGVTTRSQRYFLEQFINKKVNCAECGKELIRFYYRFKRAKKFFCDHNCRSKYLKGKMPPWYKGERIQYCLYCGKRTTTPSDPRRIKKYCSNSCQMKLRYAGNASKKTLGFKKAKI